NKGLNKKNIQLADNEFEALEIVLDYIKPGDAFLFIAHESTEEIIEKLKSVVEK
ncbi:MAG: hypothetical protein K0R94_1091, partial [Burkholderiales bacterium]|nr:hypothetical protein [Burkholderiales bacterium]